MSFIDFTNNKPVRVGAWRTDEKITGGEVVDQIDTNGETVGYAAVNDVATVASQKELQEWLDMSPAKVFHTNIGNVVTKSAASMGPAYVKIWENRNEQKYTNEVEYNAMASDAHNRNQKLTMNEYGLNGHLRPQA